MHLFRLDVDEVVLLRLDTDHLVITTWTSGEGVRSVDRS
jgi:hypothetical protein